MDGVAVSAPGPAHPTYAPPNFKDITTLQIHPTKAPLSQSAALTAIVNWQGFLGQRHSWGGWNNVTQASLEKALREPRRSAVPKTIALTPQPGFLALTCSWTIIILAQRQRLFNQKDGSPVLVAGDPLLTQVSPPETEEGATFVAGDPGWSKMVVSHVVVACEPSWCKRMGSHVFVAGGPFMSNSRGHLSLLQVTPPGGHLCLLQVIPLEQKGSQRRGIEHRRGASHGIGKGEAIETKRRQPLPDLPGLSDLPDEQDLPDLPQPQGKNTCEPAMFQASAPPPRATLEQRVSPYEIPSSTRKWTFSYPDRF